ncbi:hypothetical protein CRYUN_Cryun35bG0096000 [Craigia yunnanensis]
MVHLYSWLLNLTLQAFLDSSDRYSHTIAAPFFLFPPTDMAIRVLLWDSETAKLSDFNTHFSFEIDTQDAQVSAHGICFFLASGGSQIPLNSAGGFLGLYNTTTSDSPSNQIVSVEFDAFENPEWDPSGIGGHVGINKNSIASAVYTQWNASFHSKDTAHVLITYNSTTKN